MIPVELIMLKLEEVALQHPDSQFAMKALAFSFLYCADPAHLDSFLRYVRSIDPDYLIQLQETAASEYNIKYGNMGKANEGENRKEGD